MEVVLRIFLMVISYGFVVNVFHMLIILAIELDCLVCLQFSKIVVTDLADANVGETTEFLDCYLLIFSCVRATDYSSQFRFLIDWSVFTISNLLRAN